MSNLYNSVEPTVIDEDLLKKAVNEQEQVPIDVAEVARKEGIDPNEVTSLRLDYKNILKIDNLWAFENLTRLQLDNNIIEKIENIGFLKNLTWLDLSFNNISVIEGLSTLTKLTDLSLFNNRISKLENLDDLVNLNILSIGNNNLNSLDCINYLVRFQNLRVLNISGNSICKETNFKPYVLSRLRRLKYLDYRLVDDESMESAKEKYLEIIIAQEEEEKISNARKEEHAQKAILDAKYEAAHISGIDALFDSMFLEDFDSQKLLPIGPAQINELKEDYKEKFEIIVNEMKHFVLKRSNDKKEEIESVEQCMKSARDESDKEGKKRLDKFMHEKKEALKVAYISRNSAEVDEALTKAKEKVNELSDFFMDSEMILTEQFEEILKEFERNYTEICASITENGQSSFARIRELEGEFHEKYSELILGIYERFTKGGMEDSDDDIKEILGDKDSLVNSVNTSHDFRLARFDQQEDSLVSGISKDLEETIQKMHESEYKRNRERVSEIILFLDKVEAEIELAEENAY